jgi:hypothetical protein
MKKKNSKINFQLFPQTQKPTEVMNNVIEVFRKNENRIGSTKKRRMRSDEVLKILSGDLKRIGFVVEKDKKNKQSFDVFLDGKVLKSFDVDAFHSRGKIILEIEAGRAVANYQFLKDFFEACVIPDAENLIIAVRNIYYTKNKKSNEFRKSKDFEKVIKYFETLYISNRLQIPLKRLLIIGY